MFDLGTHVLRYWEDEGLLSPARDSADRRRYGETDLVRVAVIVRNKAAGMSLEQIRILLDAEARDRHRVLEQHLVDLDRRVAEIESSRAMTLHALECRSHDIANCPRFATNVADLLAGRPKTHRHPE